MGLFLGGVVDPALAVQHPTGRLGHAPPGTGVQLEALPGDGPGHQLPGHHFQGENEDIPSLHGQLVRHLHAEGRLAQGTHRADDVQSVIQAAVQGLIQLLKAGPEGRAGGLFFNVGQKGVHLSGRRGLGVRRRLACRPIGHALGEKPGGPFPVGAEVLVQIFAHRHRGTAVQPGELIGQRLGPGITGRVVVRQKQDGSGLGQLAKERRGLFPVAGAVQGAGVIAQLLGGQGVEGSFQQKHRPGLTYRE